MNDEMNDQPSPPSTPPTEQKPTPPLMPPTTTEPLINGIPSEVRTWALGAHLSTLSNYLSIPGFIGPLIIWLVKKDDPRFQFATDQAKEALNFQLTLYLYLAGCFALFWLVIPLFLIPAIGIVHIIFTIVAALSVNDGRTYFYPATIRFV